MIETELASEDQEPQQGPMTPDSAQEREMTSGMLDARHNYLPPFFADVLDKMVADVQINILNRVTAGPLDGHTAIASWYKIVAVHELRQRLEKAFSGRTTIGRR